MRMLITGGLVARADGVFNTDILIEGDRILELGERLHEAQQPEGTEIVDVSGCVVMPGGVDAHTHVNLTVGDAHVSDGFEAGTLAAAWGGTTTIVEHPGFGPQGCDLPHQFTVYLEQADGRCHTDYALHGVFQHVDDDVLARIPEVVAQGFPTLKAYTTYDGRLDDEGLLQVLAALRDAGGLLAVHCENHAITRFLGDKLRREAPRDPMSHPRSRPARCEAEAVNRILKLAKTAEAPRVHRAPVHGGRPGLRPRGAEGRDSRSLRKPAHSTFCSTNPPMPNGTALKYIMAPPLRTEGGSRRALGGPCGRQHLGCRYRSLFLLAGPETGTREGKRAGLSRRRSRSRNAHPSAVQRRRAARASDAAAFRGRGVHVSGPDHGACLQGAPRTRRGRGHCGHRSHGWAADQNPESSSKSGLHPV